MAARRKSRQTRRQAIAQAPAVALPPLARVTWPAGILANVLVLAPLAVAWWLQGSDAQRYYLTIQEDGWVEWATFWAFLLVVPLSIAGARQLRAAGSPIPWFPLGVGLLCLFVALEEVSWGQRLLGYRPPDYFLAENFQQEFNFHNVVDTSKRKLALKAVILGYGVVLPLAARLRPVARIFAAVGIVAPAMALAPAFFTLFAFYEEYPWGHTGEWIELGLGLGFLCVPLVRASSTGRTPGPWADPKIVLPAACVTALLLGVGTALAYNQRSPDPARVQEARREIAALRNDFASGLLETDCNLHKRLYTFAVELGQSSIWDGTFAGLTSRGLPPARAQFLLDPWNSPYWLRDRCEGNQRKAFVYSFGPNRRRDSTRTEIRGDDIGALFVDERPDGVAERD